MKKRYSILFFMLVITLLILPFTSAQNPDFERIREGITDGIKFGLGFLSPLFEMVIGDTQDSEFFFSKVLLLILLILICKSILDRSPIAGSNKKISLLLAIIISILGVRFIGDNDFFQAILIQYGTLGIAITTIVPMVIFFYFIHNTKIGTFGRKVFWAIYAITLGVIWLWKAPGIPDAANWIYGLSFLAVAIFLFFDKPIHAYLGMTGFREFERESKERAKRELRRELRELHQDYRHRIINRQEYDDERKAIKDKINELSKE